MKATFTSVWDGGIEITTPCNYDPKTRTVSDIESVDTTVENLEDEYVTLEDGTEIRDFVTEDFDWSYEPDNSEPEDEPLGFKDFMEAAKGNFQYAVALRERVTWQHPSTLVEEDLAEGEIKEENGTYILTNKK